MTSTGARWRLDARPAEIIDRAGVIHVTVDGELLPGFVGDTAASLLTSSGRRTFFGSLHEQRPGGVRRADRFDRGAWVWTESAGLQPAAGYLVSAGEVLTNYQRRASTPTASAPLVRRHVSSRADSRRVTQRNRPVAPPWLAALRGGSRQPSIELAQRVRCDVAVVGAGVAGMAAALAAARTGAEVVLVEADERLGGFLRWAGNADERRRAIELADAIEADERITVLAATTAAETRSDGTIMAVQHRSGPSIATIDPHGEKAWVLSCTSVILATGVIDRPLPFEGDHLPGVMTGYGARRLIELWAVRPGERALLATDERGAHSATELAVELTSIGVDVADVAVLADGAGHLQAEGGLALEEVLLPSGRRVAADLLITSFGFTVEPALVIGLGGVVTQLPETGDLVVGHLPATAAMVGAMAGATTIDDAERRATTTATHLARLVRPSSIQRVAPPPAPVVMANSGPTVRRPVAGFVDPTIDLRVDALQRFAASAAGATEDLLASSRRAGASSAARYVLADLARSAKASNELVDLVMAPKAILAAPTLGALAGLVTVQLREPVLIDIHRRAGAHFVAADGWMDVAHYGDVVAETVALTEGVGLRDASCEGWFLVAGPAAGAVLERVLHRAVADEPLGAVLQLDDVQLVRTARQAWELHVAAGLAAITETELLTARLEHQPWDVAVTARNEEAVRLRICGPSTPSLLRALAIDCRAGWRDTAQVGGCRCVVVSSGADDVLLEVVADAGRALWAALLVAGEGLALCPVGLDAMTTAAQRRPVQTLRRAGQR